MQRSNPASFDDLFPCAPLQQIDALLQLYNELAAKKSRTTEEEEQFKRINDERKRLAAKMDPDEDETSDHKAQCYRAKNQRQVENFLSVFSVLEDYSHKLLPGDVQLIQELSYFQDRYHRDNQAPQLTPEIQGKCDTILRKLGINGLMGIPHRLLTEHIYGLDQKDLMVARERMKVALKAEIEKNLAATLSASHSSSWTHAQPSQKTEDKQLDGEVKKSFTK